MVGSALWGVWATDKLLALDKREVVTVQLSRIMGDFIEAEARAGRPPEETKAARPGLSARRSKPRSNIWAASEGRTVLVAEAVVAGSTPDLTEAVRADVARRDGSHSRCAPLILSSTRPPGGASRCGQGLAPQRLRSPRSPLSRRTMR
jgi:hypothetical protein